MGRLAISCPESSPFHFNIFGVNPPSHISFFTTSSQRKAPPCINQGSAAWALGLGKNYGRFPLLCTLDKEVSFSCKAMWTYNPSHHFRYCGGSHGFVVPLCLFLSALLSGATPVQGVTDSLILKPQLRVLYQNPSLYKNPRLDAELRFRSHSSFLQSRNALSPACVRVCPLREPSCWSRPILHNSPIPHCIGNNNKMLTTLLPSSRPLQVFCYQGSLQACGRSICPGVRSCGEGSIVPCATDGVGFWPGLEGKINESHYT